MSKGEDIEARMPPFHQHIETDIPRIKMVRCITLLRIVRDNHSKGFLKWVFQAGFSKGMIHDLSYFMKA
jgi:hypothetical protein